MKMFFRYSVASMLSLGVFFGSCTKPDSNNTQNQPQAGGKPEKGDWMIIHQLSDPEGLNPITTSDAGARNVFSKIFEPLLDVDFASGELTPNIAEALPTLSDDHLIYTFKLKKNVKFSDGKPLTAKDVVFTMKAVKNPLLIDGGALRNYYESLVDVTTPDYYTVFMTLNKPYFIADAVLGNNVAIFPKHIFDPKGLTDKYTFAETNSLEKAQVNAAMKEFAEWFGAAERKRDVNTMIGSGPYILEEWRTGESIRLKRNDKYWNGSNNPNATSYPDKLVFKTVNDRNTALTTMKNGAIDFIEYMPPKLYVESLDTTAVPFLKKTSYIYPVYSYIGWNASRPVFADKRTRQALSHLVDRDRLIKSVMLGFALPTSSPVDFHRPEFNKDLPVYDYNPEKAKKLLADAGWGDSDNNGILDKMINGKKVEFNFTFMVNQGNEMRQNIAILLRDEFKKVGIKAEVQPIDWSVFLENSKAHEFDAYLGAWVQDPQPPDLFQLFHSSQISNRGSNYVAFNNKRADDLIEGIRLEFDTKKRTQMLMELQQVISDEQPYTFLWNVVNPAVYHKRIQGVKFYMPRPGYNPNEWWVPKTMQKYNSAN
ncbi:MAG: hypothetical protein HYZ54_02860 [Ignavibacteriae bacterium]|nr:hypothetical protein [Ignavibacteriota bacterium]